METYSKKRDMTPDQQFEAMSSAVRGVAPNPKRKYAVTCTVRTSPGSGIWTIWERCGSGQNRVCQYHAQVRWDGSVKLELCD